MFFFALGFSVNPQFTNDQGACMVISDTIFKMLLAESFFQTCTRKPVANARLGTAVPLCLSCDSRAYVDELVAERPMPSRTTVSCMRTALKTPTATSGS